MFALHELQTGLAHAILTGEPAAVEAAIADDGLSAATRLAIYRNHYLISLVDGLAATFPLVARLLGEPCFRAASRRFVQVQPPRNSCLSSYGADFAAFLAALPETASLQYLPDVARLEWALAAAGFAEDAGPLREEALTAVDPAI